MGKITCPRCGAPGEGFICAYCGAGLLPFGDERAELAALEQYHRHVEAAASDENQCSRLISGGYIPSGKAALIEAGHRCLPRVALTTLESCKEQWAVRLDAISTRLRVLGGEDSARAAAEFDAKTKAWRDQTESDTRIGCGVFAALLLGIAALVWRYAF